MVDGRYIEIIVGDNLAADCLIFAKFCMEMHCKIWK